MLSERLFSLLQSPKRGRDVEAEVVRQKVAAQLFEEEGPPPALMIGRFLVVETLGRGGMGVVYEAYDQRLQRRVALKLIQSEGDDDELDHERILHEARALARLSHPNVVQVYEVGEHEGGVFLVMELVRGVTLRQWLTDAPRSTAEILDSFLQAARGLAAAHRAGIVHRDFKPTNALVGEDGRVRLLDFGLAREHLPAEAITEVSQTDTSGTGAHQTHRAAGTPAYMSPEHFHGRCDARSDQFSFCVALFEALHGHRPYTPEQLRRLAARPDSHAPLAREDRSIPRALRRLLRRGLAPNPLARNPSMAAVIGALERLKSRGRRLTLGVAGGLTLACGVALGALGGGDAPDPCPDPGQRLGEVWGDARRETLRVAFHGVRLSYAPLAWTRAARALDAYGARWGETRAEVCAATWVQRERSEAALDLSNRCLDAALRELEGLVEELAAPTPALIAEAERLVADLPDPQHCRDLTDRERSAPITDPEFVAQIGRAKILERTRQALDAEVALTHALARGRELKDQSAEAEALLLLGRTRNRLLRRPQSAWRTLHDALDRATFAGRPDLVGATWAELALVVGYDLERSADAWLALGHARSSLSAVPTPTDGVTLLSVESQLLAAEGRFDEALVRQRQAQELVARLYPSDHPEVLAAYAALLDSLALADRVEEALALRRPHCAEIAALHGADHPWSARCELDLGLDLLDLDRRAEARELIPRVRRALAAAYGPASPPVAAADLASARIAAAEEDHALAIRRAEAALETFDVHLPRGHSDRVAALALLSNEHTALGHCPDVLRLSEELIAIHDREDSAASIDVPVVLTNLGECLCDLGRCPEALPYFTRLMTLYETSPPDQPVLRAFPLRGIGRVHLTRETPALAVLVLEEALKILDAHPAGEWDGVAEAHVATLRDLADALTALKQTARAKQLRRRADALERTHAAP